MGYVNFGKVSNVGIEGIIDWFVEEYRRELGFLVV